VLTEDPANTVIGLVRDRAGTINKAAADPELKDRSNYHIVEGDLNSYDSLKVQDSKPHHLSLQGTDAAGQKAAAEVAKITRGAIDYLIANGGYISLFDNFEGIGPL